MSKLCQYCGNNPVASDSSSCCSSCVFSCGKCHKLTRYEFGYAGSDLCDMCFSFSELKLQFGQAIRNLERSN
jgi:hypothetical protein